MIVNKTIAFVFAQTIGNATVAQWVKAFASYAESWVFESQPRQTQVVKTVSDSSTAKRSEAGVSVTGSQRCPLLTDVLCHRRCGTLKNPHCSMAMSADHRSKLGAFHRQWRFFPLSEKFSSGTKTPKQSNHLISFLYLSTL